LYVRFAYKGKKSNIPNALKIYKKLAGQTVIYGFGTIIPRILNYSILTVYYTRLFSVEQFGVITELYAYVTFLMILLTYGTETGYFRFAVENRRNLVFSSLLASLFISSVIFVICMLLFRVPIAHSIHYDGNVEFISILVIIIGIDSFCTIPFAKLRKEERSLKFACLKILNVVITIFCVVFFYEILPKIVEQTPIGLLIKLRSDVSYVLISNLIASSVIFILLIPESLEGKFEFDWKLLKQILAYSLPLLLAGLAGTVNETMDRILLKYLIPDKSQAIYILGIYGANYRIAVLLFIFIQMFRYAIEPFYFNYYESKNDKVIFSQIMRLFIGISVVISMSMLFYLDYVKFFISPKFHEGLKIVPVVLLGYVCYGIFFNQSIWYKFTKKTSFAIILTAIGAIITLLINIIFVKKYSYMASAYAHVFAYSAMIVVSFFIGQKYYPINYKLNQILEYLIVACVIFVIRFYLFDSGKIYVDIVSALLIFGYSLYILIRENIINKYMLEKWKLR
jgi:O-antigen/teichoic acid export membrane protein